MSQIPPELLALMASGQMGREMAFGAQMLLSITSDASRDQDERDKRWRNFCHHVETLQSEGKLPAEGGAIEAILVRYGMQPSRSVPPSLAHRPMTLAQYMDKYGEYGWDLMDTYEAQDQPDAPPQCDCCQTYGAAYRCASCGEFYCGLSCQQRHWRKHKPICNAASLYGPPKKIPQLMTREMYDRLVLRKVAAPKPGAEPSDGWRPTNSGARGSGAVSSSKQVPRPQAAGSGELRMPVTFLGVIAVALLAALCLWLLRG